MFVSNNETPGFGANCTNPEFTSQFKGKSASGKISFNKSGATSDNEIDAISGATITTNAVTEAVNGAIIFSRKTLTADLMRLRLLILWNRHFPVQILVH